MPMSSRLLRPRSTVHPEAAAWRSAVVTNGGSVTAATLKAVDTFCRAIDQNNLRNKFLRLNLFCGTGILACQVPLYRNTSATATGLGNSVDTNTSALFVDNDYNETGTSGGLIGNGSSKYLNTGLAHNLLTQNDTHIAVYETARASATFRTSIGCRASGTGTAQANLILGTWASTSNYTLLAYETSSSLNLTSSVGGFYLGNITGATASALFRNGGGKVTSVGTTRNPGSQSVFVFALNDAGSMSVPTNARLAGYSLGFGMTDAEVSAYNTIMQTFQTSLQRAVA